MKDKILKLISVTIILCMLITMLIPNFVKSATLVVSNMTNTGRGIGNTSIFTVKINGYSNLYCVRGGAEIRTGWQLNDGGVSLYTTTGAVVTNSSAMQWLLDNMYLTEGADSNTQKAMRQNLINIMKKYNTYKDSNGNSLLNKKLNGNGINDEWITKAVDDVINDKTTLFAVQQYAIWNHVKNTYTSYYNTMQNSDGSYNAIPGAKASRVHYTALYITLNELAAEAQKNGYKSPNNSGRGFDIKIEKQSNTKATISSDGKSVLAGPYKLKNNHGLVTKSFSATINSDKADKVETVNAEGKGVSVSESQGEFYVKVTYNKGFAKGTEYKIGINVGLSGYRTFATLLDTPNAYHQPLVTIRKEAVNTSTKTDITVKEELKGDYSLILEKISSEGEKISGVTFKVKEGSGEAKTYGPTDSNGEVKVVTNKKIEKEGIDEYTITEVNVGKNKLVKVQDEIKLYVTKANVNGKYVASKVSFEKDKEVKEKVVKLEDGTNATVTASVSGNTVKLIIPNKPEDEPKEFDMALRKYISEVKRDGKTVEIADRTPVINASSASEYLKNKTAGYYHTKNPITVKQGDTVIYTLRVYNEGYIDGYAKEITDYLPAGLEYIEDSQINKDNGWTITKNEDGTATVKTDKLKGELIPPANGGQGFLSYYADIQVGKDVKEPSFSKEVTIECKVKEDMQDNKLLVNVAEITNYGYNDEQGNYIEAGKDGVDIDSEENNVFRKKDNIKNIDEYYENNVKPQDKENKDNYKGEQDDDDFERILVEPNDTPPGTPEIHKGVKDILNQDSGYNGDEEHDWVIQTSIPTGINKFKKYIVTDTIHENLVFDEEKGIEKVIVKIGDKQLEKDKDFQVTYNKETRELKISFIEGDFIAGQSLEEGSIIEIRFKTTFAKDEQGNIKALNQEIPNQATLIYDNGSGKEEEKKSEEPEVHTGAVAVYKYNEETKVALEGAKFKIATSKENAEKGIFVKDVNGKDIEEISNDKGIATFTGLEFGGDANASEENKRSDGTYSYDFENAKKTYYIIETEAPEGFNKYEGVIEVEVSKNTTLTEIKNMKSVANTPKGEFDLALRKYITKVISKDSSENVVELENRIPNPNVDSLKDKTSTTASYLHSKNPVIVKVGDIIIYTLRVYNEGDIAGYAQEIVDHLPEGLEFVNDEFNSKYGWIIDENDKSLRTIRTTYLSKQRNEKENIISAFNKNTGELSYKDIQVKCKVKDSVSESQKLTNIAEITKYIGKDGEETIDRDSKEEVKLPNDEELPNYKDDEISKEYVPGQEDDDDFEKVIIESTPPEIHKGIKDILNQNSGYNGDEEHDWVIRTSIPAGINKFKKYIVTDTIHENLVFDEEKGIEKVIVKIGDKQLEKDKDFQVTYNKETRELKISFIEGDFIAGQSLEEGSIIEIRFKTTFAKDEQGNIKALNQEIPNQATLIYDNGSGKEEEKKSEEPEVHTGAVAVYKYNEETKVALEGAKFKIATSKENAEKGIFVKDVNGKDIEEISNDKGIATFTGLEFGGDANASEENKRSDGTYSYDFENAKKTYYIIETEAPEGFNKYEGVIEVEVSKNTTLTEIKNMKSIANSPEEKDFDLALRKFITGVNDKEVTSRIPVFKIDEKGNYVYNHDKEPVLVANSNIVTYTLRVYNEGEVAGYAKEIKDNIPEGLEFMPDNELNKEYRWIMLDKYGKETDNVADSKYITTDYLSKEQEKTAGSNLLKPFDEKAYEAGSIKEPDYKEVKVAFKVNMPDKSEEIIINKAEISDEVDENGNKVTDKDSTPNEWIDGEDDQDIEKIKIQYFDLALRKWVTKAIVTENGVETIHETGHKAEDDPEAVVKVDLKKSDINKVTVKFEYKIRIENQGKIAGYAKEISDYIPEGLKFVKEDNPLWEEVEGKVVTDQLKDTLLQPGETAEVSILLTWINREDNMGLKVNVAEISKDYNEYGAPDIDSTPNNKVTGEDDIDDATVLLSVTTGEEPVYVILTISILTILAGGIFTIKRYVLD